MLTFLSMLMENMFIMNYEFCESFRIFVQIIFYVNYFLSNKKFSY